MAERFAEILKIISIAPTVRVRKKYNHDLLKTPKEMIVKSRDISVAKKRSFDMTE